MNFFFLNNVATFLFALSPCDTLHLEVFWCMNGLSQSYIEYDFSQFVRQK